MDLPCRPFAHLLLGLVCFHLHTILGCTVRSVRAVNVVRATQKMQNTKQDDSSVSKVHQCRGLQPGNSIWRCRLQRRRRKMFTATAL